MQRMPGNYIVDYGALRKEKQQKLFEQEKLRILMFAAAIKKIDVETKAKCINVSHRLKL